MRWAADFRVRMLNDDVPRHRYLWELDRDAYQLLGQLAESTVANIVDPVYTVVAKFPKRYLPEAR